jgi:hypothetical protein
MAVEWADPPPGRRAQSEEWEAIAQELRSRPGQWAIVARGRSAETATRIKNGTLAAFRPAGTFEARTTGRKNASDQRCDIYARYVGDGRE